MHDLSHLAVKMFCQAVKKKSPSLSSIAMYVLSVEKHKGVKPAWHGRHASKLLNTVLTFLLTNNNNDIVITNRKVYVINNNS